MADDDELERYAAESRRRQQRVLVTGSVIAIVIGVTVAVVILRAGDTTGYSFFGHPGRPYGNWTKLFALMGAGFVALGVALARSAFRLRRR